MNLSDLHRTLSHDEAVAEVYRLTPQIREYDEFMYMGVRWLPYTMFFHHKNYRSDVINTDDFGFRWSDHCGKPIAPSSIDPEQPVNLLVGGSTTLGTGATSDATTIASRLSARTGEVWLNFGGRGYNATQELLLFLMHQHRFKNIQRVVVFSGINTLTLEGLPDEFADDHGRYYYAYEYQHYMGQYNDDLKKRARTYASALDQRKKGFLARCFNGWNASHHNPADVIITDEHTNTEARVDRAAWVICNALQQWKLLLSSSHTKLSFVLQPMSYWTKEQLTQEEQDIFRAIDACPNNFWRLFSNILGRDVYHSLRPKVQSFCQQLAIDFTDMNEFMSDSPLIDEYLFVDRVHFNDRGYDEVARLLVPYLV